MTHPPPKSSARLAILAEALLTDGRDASSGRWLPGPLMRPMLNGKACKLNGAEWATLIVLMLHDGPGGCWPSKATISQITGHDRSTITRALKRLDDMGIIARDGGKGGRGKSTRYKLITGANLRPFVDPKRAQSRIKTGADSHEKRRESTQKEARDCAPNSNGKAEERQQQQAAGPAAVAEPMEAALIAAGIGEPARARLAARCRAASVSADGIRRKAAQAREHGKRGGVLIAEIEGLCEAAEHAKRQADANRQQANASVDAAAVELQGILDELDEAERDAVCSEAEKRLRVAQRHDLDSNDPERREAASRQLTTETLFLARQQAARRNRRPPPRRPARPDAIAVGAGAG